jgi:hypothetical protein
MKQLLLGGATLLALAASEPAARATLFDFTYTGSLVTFTVPTTDTYQILAFGAQGGSGTFNGFGPVGIGGRGAEIGGNFSLTAGETLQIAVGGAGGNGSDNDAGGGGGSFIVGPGNTPLVIAGGGGGGGAVVVASLPGLGGLTGPDGRSVFFGNGGNGGINGNGGGAGPGGGGGGGGFFSAGGKLPFGLSGEGGGGFPGLAGGLGGVAGAGDGGFGGGGGGGGVGSHEGSGGGGGYSGGGGGFAGNNGDGRAGGGGSFDAGTDQILVADFWTGNGEVIITELAAAVPEPGRSRCSLRASLASLLSGGAAGTPDPGWHDLGGPRASAASEECGLVTGPCPGTDTAPQRSGGSSTPTGIQSQS